jgi:uncharacterized integral membrane protein
MKKVVRWIVTIPLGALLVIFLVANRAPVALSLDPLSTSAPALATPALPLWIWLALFLFAGVGLGAAAMWVSDHELRVRAKADRLELKALKRAVTAEAPASPPTEADKDA